jgi:hypothetical protein
MTDCRFIPLLRLVSRSDRYAASLAGRVTGPAVGSMRLTARIHGRPNLDRKFCGFLQTASMTALSQ